MFTIKSSEAARNTCTPHVIPCRVHHNGPTEITKRYWAPYNDTDGNQTTYFRGRKLRGRSVKLPLNYKGLVLKNSGNTIVEPIPKTNPAPTEFEDEALSEDEVREIEEPVKVLDSVSEFNELMVWGHDHIPASDDDFVKNVEEWITFAEAIHGSSSCTVQKNG